MEVLFKNYEHLSIHKLTIYETRMYVSPEPQVSSEYELVETLKQIWGNRNCITPQDLEKLKLFTNKGLYDQISS